MKKKILVTGASGFIGSKAVQALVKQGYHVRCFVRSTSILTVFPESPLVEIAHGDMKDEASLRAATRDVQVVVHLAAATSEKASAAAESYAVNVQGATNLVNACTYNKVKRLIVVSSQSTKREKQGNYGSTKKLADTIFRASDVEWTILKPTLVYGPGSKGLFVKILKLIESLPTIPIVGDGKYTLQPTYVDDLVEAICAVITANATIRKEYDLAGGTRLEFNEVIAEVQRQLQQSKKVMHVPFWCCYSGTKVLSCFTKNPPVTTDNLLGLVQETSIDLTPAKQDFGYSPISFSEGMRRTLWGDLPAKKIKKIGIIGLGKMGLLHASFVSYLPDTKIVALFDVNPKSRNNFYSMNLRAPFFTNIDDFFASSEMDAVFISVPPAFTRSIIEKCATFGINFFVEKPLANMLDNAQKIVRLAEEKKLRTSVGYMYAYRKLFERVQQLLAQRVLGKISSFEGTAFVTQVLSPKKGWRYQKKTAGGGCVSLHGTHLLYMAYALFNVPQRVTAKLYYPYSEVEDRAFVRLFYKDYSGTIKVSWSEQGYPTLTTSLKIIGSHGTLELDEQKIVLNLRKSAAGFPLGRTVISREDLPSEELELGGEGYFTQDKMFVESLAVPFSKVKNKVTVVDAYNVQRILQGIYDSSAQQKPVTLE